MSKPNLLLVDADDRNRRVLEVSLRKAGFLVTTSIDGADALHRARQAAPDVLIADTELPELDGFELCRELRDDPTLAATPVILISGESSPADRARGLEAGADEFLFRPVFIKEVVARCRLLLDRQKRQLTGEGSFSGQLSELSVVDLLQTMELGEKSGVIHLRGVYDKRGAIYFRDGKVIDAELGHLQGEAAVFRLLLWNEADFEVEIKTIRRKDVILVSNEELLLEGLRRVDEWARLLEQLPALHTVFKIDYGALGERLGEIPDEVNSIIRLFDGRRTLMQVVDDGDHGDIEALEVISKLYFEGLIYDGQKIGSRERPRATGRLTAEQAGIRADEEDDEKRPRDTAELPVPPGNAAAEEMQRAAEEAEREAMRVLAESQIDLPQLSESDAGDAEAFGAAAAAAAQEATTRESEEGGEPVGERPAPQTAGDQAAEADPSTPSVVEDDDPNRRTEPYSAVALERPDLDAERLARSISAGDAQDADDGDASAPVIEDIPPDELRAKVEVERAEPEAEPEQAEAEPEQAEAEPEQAEAEPEQAEAEPEQAEAEPEQAEAEPEQAEAEPEQAEAEPEQAEAEPEQAAEAEQAEAEVEPEAEAEQAEAKPEAEPEQTEAAEQAEAEPEPEAEAEQAEAEPEQAEAEQAEAEPEAESEQAEAKPEAEQAEPEAEAEQAEPEAEPEQAEAEQAEAKPEAGASAEESVDAEAAESSSAQRRKRRRRGKRKRRQSRGDAPATASGAKDEKDETPANVEVMSAAAEREDEAVVAPTSGEKEKVDPEPLGTAETAPVDADQEAEVDRWLADDGDADDEGGQLIPFPSKRTPEGDEINRAAEEAAELEGADDPSAASINVRDEAFFASDYEPDPYSDQLFADFEDDRPSSRGKWWALGVVVIALLIGVPLWYYIHNNPYIGDGPAHLQVDPNRPTIGGGDATQKGKAVATSAARKDSGAADTAKVAVAPAKVDASAPTPTPADAAAVATTTPDAAAVAQDAKVAATSVDSAPAVATTPDAAAKPSVRERYDKLIAEARALLAKRRRAKAYRLLFKARKLVPDGWEVLDYLSWREYNRGRMKPGRAMARKALASNKDAPYANLVVGAVAHEAGKKAAARQRYQRFLTLCPKCPEARDIKRALKSLK